MHKPRQEYKFVIGGWWRNFGMDCGNINNWYLWSWETGVWEWPMERWGVVTIPACFTRILRGNSNLYLRGNSNLYKVMRDIKVVQSETMFWGMRVLEKECHYRNPGIRCETQTSFEMKLLPNILGRTRMLCTVTQIFAARPRHHLKWNYCQTFWDVMECFIPLPRHSLRDPDIIWNEIIAKHSGTYWNAFYHNPGIRCETQMSFEMKILQTFWNVLEYFVP